MTVTSFCCCCWATHKLFLLPFYSYREEILFCPTKRSLTVSHRFFYSSPDQEDPQTVIVALSVFQSTRDWLWRSRTFFGNANHRRRRKTVLGSWWLTKNCLWNERRGIAKRNRQTFNWYRWQSHRSIAALIVPIRLQHRSTTKEKALEELI